MLSFFPRGVLDEILNLIGSVSEDFPSYSSSAGGSYNLDDGRASACVGAGGGCFDICTLLYPSLLFLPLSGRRPDID